MNSTLVSISAQPCQSFVYIGPALPVLKLLLCCHGLSSVVPGKSLPAMEVMRFLNNYFSKLDALVDIYKVCEV